MKYLILLGDGMSDEKYAELGNKTPLQTANTPNLDRMARHGLVGLARTVPEGLPPGSDVANLAVFGYDPRTCYTGRSPLEAISMGVKLGPDDVAFRMNMVTLRPHGTTIYMEDFSAGHISSEESRELVATLQNELGGGEFEFHPGVGYRHLMVWRNGMDSMKAIPPHDISGKPILDFLPRGPGSEQLLSIMNSSQMLFLRHPVNEQRKKAGKPPASSIWLWGHGKTPQIMPYNQRYGLSGAVISAVDLIKGIGLCAGLEVINVPGATGYIDTNYKGKAEAALDALKTRDFVYVHVEAPDEASHSGKMADKIQAIEDFDRLVVGTILDGIAPLGDYTILSCPDHPTPVRLMTHTSDPVPFVIYRGDGKLAANGTEKFDEDSATASGLVLSDGFRLMETMMNHP